MNRKKADSDQRCIIRENGGVPFLTFPIFPDDEIVHGFSTRLGGVSEGIWSSMNLSFSRGDREERVRENFDRIARAIGFSVEDLVFTDQVHGTDLLAVTEQHRGMGIARQKPENVDGLITNVPGIPLAGFYADCVPLFFYDPVKRAVGIVHSGWRGTAGKIGAAAVSRMSRAFGSDPSDILAAIGPSICGDCYEISRDVAEEFMDAFARGRWSRFLRDDGNGHYHLDLWTANEQILLDAGLKKEHLFITDLCTCCNPDLLFSHRATHGKRGNLAGFIMLKDKAGERKDRSASI